MSHDDHRHRVASWEAELRAALRGLYRDADAVAAAAIERVAASAATRRPALRALDAAREREPDWYQRPERVAYMAYADRFAGDLRGVQEKIPYLRELGVDVLHLMSVLRARPGDSDGGYAIEDHRTPEPRLGSSDDLVGLTDALHEAGVALCLDLVLNHTSDTHRWAVAAKEGDERARRRYLVFGDRALPDRYERTLPEVFPELAPGSFTWVDEVQGWVWTTFREFQWDLDWSNPDVFLEVADVVLHLAGVGVDVLRLDAIAFTWKRMGTDCQNQPEAHLIAQALRAVAGMAAPGTVFLAEAIVGPDQLVAYLGRHDLERRECELAYHNQLMVMGWSMLAERRTELATAALARLPAPPDRTSWFTYVRCHDDIGWAVSDADAGAAGLDPRAHRAFLAAFYRGDFAGSFARGTPFSTNPITGDERTCGMTSALCGLATAKDDDDVERALRRLLLLYGLAFGYGGTPVIWMGDEIALGDEEGWAGDSRWTHRPRMDWAAAARRHDPTSIEGRAWAGMRALVDARRRCPPLHGAGRVRPIPAEPRPLFAWERRHRRFGAMLGLANFGETAVEAPSSLLEPLRGHGRPVVDVLAGDEPVDEGPVELAPLAIRWCTADSTYRTVPMAALAGGRGQG